MNPAEHAQLYRELAEHAESPTELAPFEISDLAARARQAAEGIEGRRVTPKQLKELASLIGSVTPDTDRDCLAIAVATYFESSPHHPDNDPPYDEDGETGWTQWTMAKTNEMLLEAAKIVLTHFGGDEGSK